MSQVRQLPLARFAKLRDRVDFRPLAWMLLTYCRQNPAHGDTAHVRRSCPPPPLPDRSPPVCDVRVTLTSEPQLKLLKLFFSFRFLPLSAEATCFSDESLVLNFDKGSSRTGPARSNSVADKYFRVECLFRPYWTLMK